MASSPYLKSVGSMGKNKILFSQNEKERLLRNIGNGNLNKGEINGLLSSSHLKSALKNHFEKSSNSNNSSKESIYNKPIRKKNQFLRIDKDKTENK